MPDGIHVSFNPPPLLRFARPAREATLAGAYERGMKGGLNRCEALEENAPLMKLAKISATILGYGVTSKRTTAKVMVESTFDGHRQRNKYRRLGPNASCALDNDWSGRRDPHLDYGTQARSRGAAWLACLEVDPDYTGEDEAHFRWGKNRKW